MLRALVEHATGHANAAHQCWAKVGPRLLSGMLHACAAAPATCFGCFPRWRCVGRDQRRRAPDRGCWMLARQLAPLYLQSMPAGGGAADAAHAAHAPATPVAKRAAGTASAAASLLPWSVGGGATDEGRSERQAGAGGGAGAGPPGADMDCAYKARLAVASLHAAASLAAADGHLPTLIAR
jgi:hypothetical protein